MASVEELKARSKAHIDGRFSFKSWLHAAQKTRNLAQEADTKGDIENAYVGYRKTVNLARAMLDHPEYKQHVTHKSSPEYYSYMDLKSKLLPTSSRMQELERTLTRREEEEHQSGHASESAQTNGERDGSHQVHDVADSLHALSVNVTPNSTGGSAASTSRASANGAGSRGPPSAARSTPPPIPSASTKPIIPSPSSKPAYSNSSRTQQPLTPTSPPTPSTNHGWTGMSATSHRVSSKLKERMAALHNAGMRDVNEYKTEDHERSPSLPTWSDSGKPALAPKPAGTANGHLHRSPAVHYSRSNAANDYSMSGTAAVDPLESSSAGDYSLASTIPSTYSQENTMSDPWPPKTLAPKPSTESMRARISPPQASPLGEGQDRPGSAPPASTGPPDASGPATTSDDWLTQSNQSEADSFLAHDNQSLHPKQSAAAQSHTDADTFANRFPDVEHGELLPTEYETNKAYVSRQGGITQPFLPAPTSRSTLQYEGRSVRSGRSDTQSTTQSQSTVDSVPSTHLASGRYQTQMSPKTGMSGGQLVKPPRPLPKPPSIPSLPNRSTTTIEPEELWRFLENAGLQSQPSILLIDVRTRKEFSGGHIKGNTVCIEPFTLSTNSSAFSIENSLVVSPEAERRWFADRASFDLIVIYDKHSRPISSRDSASYNGTAPRNSPVTFRSIADQAEDSVAGARVLATLSSAIYELNFSDEHKRLKRSPLLLVGGYEAWLKDIGEKGIQKETYTQSQYHPYHQDHHARPHESHSMPALQPSRPFETQPNKVESEYQAMLANRARAESALASRPHADGPEASADTKRQHRKAVLSGDGILSPSPLHNLQMPGPPPPAYSGTPVAPVAVHRTGPASPYEAYPSSSFQAMPFSQSSSRAEYFEGYTSPQKNGYPATSSGPSLSQPYPGRPIEYPTLQQKQQFGTGVVQRPGSTMALDHASNVQKPAPTLARANSSSLHLYQSGDYLNAPAFGEFPKRLMALGDGVVGLTGLKNLGNTCYMNSMIQCMSATIPLARFFKEGSYKAAINRENPLGTKGVLADAVAQLIRSLWSEQYRFLAPVTFREAICRFAPQFKGSDQHDSQEFLAFLLDGLHEDLNLVRQKPPPIEFTPEREKELETLPTQIAAEREWNIYLRRDDSIIVRLLQGQYKSQLRCMTCGTTSTTYNTFMYLSLPIPSGRNIREVTLAQCIDFFTQPETLDGDDAWNCPKCKVPRRATKALTISRLPPILLIHLKRFSFQGPFTDKIDTSVSFPVRGLDMSRHLPQPLSPHIKAKYEHAVGHALDEPTSQVYDLHAVSNHFGNLSSGHYTAFVRNRGQWHELNDSKVGRLTEAQIATAGKSAYTLWYSRRQV